MGASYFETGVAITICRPRSLNRTVAASQGPSQPLSRSGLRSPLTCRAPKFSTQTLGTMSPRGLLAHPHPKHVLPLYLSFKLQDVSMLH